MASRDVAFYGALIKIGIFSAVSIVVTGTLIAIMGNIGFGAQKEYRALFSSASGLKDGDDVRIAGVSVGEVSAVEIVQRSQALITFTAKSDVPLTTHSRAEIRFLNLVGQRYMALAQGPQGGRSLDEGDTIALRNTEPSLNLTELFNGFQPLFQALQPDQVNTLALNLVRVLQGEGGTIQGLLARTASLTNTLADRDRLIGDVIDNLSTLLETVDDRRHELGDLVIQLKNWMTNLARDRSSIGRSVTNLSSLSAQLADLLTRSRPYLKRDLGQLRRLLKILNSPNGKRIIGDTIRRMPEFVQDMTRTGTYGSWYNYYLCDFGGTIVLPRAIQGIPVPAQMRRQLSDVSFHSTAKRCR